MSTCVQYVCTYILNILFAQMYVCTYIPVYVYSMLTMHICM